MKIAVDASLLHQHNRTGTHNYLYFLLKALSKIDNDNSYDVFFRTPSDSNFYLELFSGNKNFTHHILKKLGSWTQISLPLGLYRYSPDILLCPWHTMPGIHPSKTKIVSTFHAANEHARKHDNVLRYTAKHSDNIIAVSNYTKEGLVTDFEVNPSKIKVIYEGLAPSTYKKYPESAVLNLKEKYKIEGDYILSISTISKRKNIENMLRAFAKSMRSHALQNTLFVIAGKMTPECVYLYDLPKELGIQEKVMFLGAVSWEDGPILISGAKLLAYVSKSEGFGLNVLEGMSSGVPVVSTTQGAVPEVSGDAALLVNPESVDEISVAFTNMLTEESQRAFYIQRGLDRVKMFSWEKTARNTINYFEEICSYGN